MGVNRAPNAPRGRNEQQEHAVVAKVGGKERRRWAAEAYLDDEADYKNAVNHGHKLEQSKANQWGWHNPRLQKKRIDA